MNVDAPKPCEWISSLKNDYTSQDARLLLGVRGALGLKCKVSASANGMKRYLRYGGTVISTEEGVRIAKVPGPTMRSVV